MKYSVGYNMLHSNELLPVIIDNKEEIDEVYFSWADFANGRNSQTEQAGYSPWEALYKQEEDLKLLNAAGIRFNLLFNGNCYGADSLSRAFYEKIGESVQYIKSTMNLSSVTTTSPLIAKFIKNNFGDIKVRASVNMEIGTIQGMDYLSEYFDGYYMKREYNRNFKKIEELKARCDSDGKTLHILANSGCLNYCSAHVFHDNLVAHETEIAKRDNCYVFEGVCNEYLKSPEKRISLIRDTNFIRPEDIKYYEKYFTSVKLATRVSNNPVMILKSYLRQRYSGNITELLEPNHSGAIYPYVIENSKLKNDFLFCDKNCFSCNRCSDIYNNALLNLEEIF